MPTSKPAYVWDGSQWIPIGPQVGGVQTRWIYTATGGETTLSGLDDNGLTLSYTPGFEQIYLNGVLLIKDEDYTATTGTSITGLTALSINDIIQIITLDVTSVDNTYTQDQADSLFLTQNSASTTYATQTSLTDGLASKLDLAGGKILQIVRATDTTQRVISSSSFTDVTGMSVTITPQYSDSAILIEAVFVSNMFSSTGPWTHQHRITDSSNNPISGAELSIVQISDHFDITGSNAQNSVPVFLRGYATPATTSAVTYKLQANTQAADGGPVRIQNSLMTGQMYAIEVSA